MESTWSNTVLVVLLRSDKPFMVKIGPSGVRAMPLGLPRQNVVATLSLSSFSTGSFIILPYIHKNMRIPI